MNTRGITTNSNNDAIGKLFKVFIEGEKAIEISRLQLNTQPDFDPFLLFKRIDFDQKKHITQYDLIKFLRLYHVEGNINEINYVIMTYDSDSSKQLNYNQFLNMVLSQSYYSSIKKSQNGYQHYITPETELKFVSLLQLELKLAKDIINKHLPHIVKQEGFTVQGLIKELKGNLYLIEDNLGIMIQLGLLQCNRDELKGLMRRLDLTKNGKITIEELNRILYFPNTEPPSLMFNKRRQISMEPVRPINLYSRSNNEVRGDGGNRNHNNFESTPYLRTEGNMTMTMNRNRDNTNTINVSTSNRERHRERQREREMPHYPILQTESTANINNSRRLFIETEDNRPRVTLPNNNQRERPIESYNYQPMRTEPNRSANSNSNTHNRNRSFELRTNSNNQPLNQRRNVRIPTEAYNEHPTVFATNYVTTIPNTINSIGDAPVNTINSTISLIERSLNRQRQQQSQRSQIHNQSASNIRINNGQYNTNGVLPIRVSDTLHIRQSPERHFNSTEEEQYIDNRTSNRINTEDQESLRRQRDRHRHLQAKEESILTILKEIIDIEKAIESQKIRLSHQKDFNIEDAFRIFESKPNKSQLSLSDIKLAYASFNLYPSTIEVELLLNKYDLDHKGYLNYSDFFDMLTPFNKPIRNEMERRQPNKYRPSFNKTNVFNGITKGLIKDLLSTLINSESHLNSLRKSINTETINEESIRKIYSRIDSQVKGYLTPKEVKQFFKDNNMNISQNDIDLLYIRFDRDRDGKIVYEEFANEFTLIVP